MAANIIDSFFVALGFKVDSKELDKLQQKAGGVRDSILSMGTAITVAVGGLAARAIAKIGGEFESNQIAIAGFMKALDLAPTFDDAFAMAETTMNQIIADAAKLPGTAEEYIQVFRDGLPVLKKAMPGGSIQEMVKFSDTFAAVGRTLKIDAPQIGRDLKLMLSPQGRAGLHVRTFSELMSFMQELPGQANLSAQAFNAMSQPARLKLLEATFEKLAPMIAKSAESWDAMSGAATSMVTQLVRLGTKRLFEGMKAGIGGIVDAVFDAKGNLTAFGQSIVDAGQRISAAIVQFARDGAVIVGWLVDLGKHGPLGKSALVGIAVGIVGIRKALAGGVLGAVVLLVDDLVQLQTGGQSVIGMLLEKFPVATRIAGMALATLGGALLAFKVRAVASMLAVAAANAAAFLPFYAAGAAIALVALAIYEVYKNWDQLMSAIRSGPHDLAVALGFGSSADTAGRAAQELSFGRGAGSSGGDVIWRNPATGMEETHPPGWIPPTPMSVTGAQAGASSASSTSQTNTTTITGNTFQIDGSKDPKATAEAIMKKLQEQAQAVTRNGQTGVHL